MKIHLNLSRKKKLLKNILIKKYKSGKLTIEKCIELYTQLYNNNFEENSIDDSKSMIKYEINDDDITLEIKSENIKESFKEDSELEDIPERFSLYLLFNNIYKFDFQEIKERIQSITNEEVEIFDTFDNVATSNVYGHVSIGKEKFNIAGFDIPIPKDVAEDTINCTDCSKEEIEIMQNHNYHIIAFYEGESTDYNVIYNAYAKLAYGFLNHNFLGLANKYAYNVISPFLIQGMFEEGDNNKYSSTPAMKVWRNFIKIPHGDKIWYVTKGNYLYGAHEYAYKGDLSEREEICNIFDIIFNYEYTTKSDIKAGSNIKIGTDMFLTFKPLYELNDKLQKEKEIDTLVVEKTN